MGACTGDDPLTGNELFAVTFFAPGSVGKLIFIDTVTHRTEGYDFLADDGAWGITYVDGAFIVSTCTKYASLQRFDLAARRWNDKVLKGKSYNEKDTYLYGFAHGSDGNVYAGTYGECSLMRYVPQTHTLEFLGRASDNPDNMYSRNMYGGVEGRVYFQCGRDDAEVGYYDMEKNEICRALVKTGKDGGDLQVVSWQKDYFLAKTAADAESYAFYDPLTGKAILDGVDFNNLNEDQLNNPMVIAERDRIENDPVKVFHTAFPDFNTGQMFRMLTLKDGSVFGYESENNSFVHIKDGKQHAVINNTVEAPINNIHYLVPDGDGTLWGAAGMGNTIFWCDPETGRYENFGAPGNGGEPYGMAPVGDYIYMTGYSRGDFIVYNKKQPRDGKYEINPRVVRTIGPEYVRPHTYSHLDKNGDIWTGWWSAYGTRRMCLSKWNVKTHDVTLYERLKENTTVDWLAVTDAHVWFTTCNSANGLPAVNAPLFLCAVDYDGNMLFEKQFPAGVRFGKFGFIGRYGLLPAEGKLLLIDDAALNVRELDTARYGVNDEFYAVLKLNDSLLAVSGGEKLYIADIPNQKIIETIGHPVEDGIIRKPHWVVMYGENIYMSSWGDLYRAEN